MVIKAKKEAWFEAGLTLLTEIGPHSLTIDGLCRKLSVTKGSFYHHFRNRDSYIKQLWEYWGQKNAERVVDATKKSDICEKASTILHLIYKIPRDRELALRALALYDTTSRPFQERIDRKRKNNAEDLNRNYFGDDEVVKIISTIDYAWYLGTQLMIPPPDDKELKKIIEVYQQMKQAYLKITEKEV